MLDKEFKAKDKVVRQMSKDGLTQKNLHTGDIENISEKEADIQFGEHEKDFQFAQVPKSGEQKETRNIPDRVGRHIVPSGRSRLQYKPYEIEYEEINFSSLRMSWEELPGDEPAGFLPGEVPEEEPDVHIPDRMWKPKMWNQTAVWKITSGATKMAVKGSHRWLHRKLSEVEDQNNGVKAAHVEEQTTERFLKTEHRVVRKIVRGVKKRKRKRLTKLRRKANMSYVRAEKWKLLNDKFDLKYGSTDGQKTTGAKAWMKKKLQRKYNAAARKSEKAAEKFGKASAEAAKESSIWIIRILKKVMEFVNLVLSWIFAGISFFCFLMIAGFLLIIVLVIGLIVIFTTISYVAESQDIHDASVLTTQLEADLEKEIYDIPTNPKWDYIDEFHYDLDPIGHDPFTLMAWLTTKYDDFKYADVEPFLRELHNARYDLTYDVEVEEREDEDGEPYNWYILNVTLRSKSIMDIIKPEMELDTTGELKDRFDGLMETKGGRQIVDNPFNYDWTGSVSSKYGYRLNPLGGGNIQFHRGIDIPVPEGTPVKAGVTGKVVETGYNEDFGNYIVLEDKKGAVQVKYAHCDSLNLGMGAEVKAGETVIALSGNSGNSTGAHLHIEVKEDGEYVNSLYYVEWEAKKEV